MFWMVFELQRDQAAENFFSFFLFWRTYGILSFGGGGKWLLEKGCLYGKQNTLKKKKIVSLYVETEHTDTLVSRLTLT